ncbi:FtsW/RodA/SpoVE family cell cycle protein [Parenemella sanctibonifatiensis]|uniref:Cell division protein n=1 Tax=Parenemella sanctibonifatiensis TaxID=2016505 RepID=A0A255ED30_9ACTN|nr:FtsW/RodA/SpoVE family cell cycle protein [Parenemella sanctibonifatiensis]OYN89468.1 cell division protein [Parenemella sanctibonifatiensis]
MSDGSLIVVYRRRRHVELLLSLFAAAMGLAAYVTVHLNRDGVLPDNLPVAAALWFGAAVVLHLAVRWRLPYADPLMLPIVLLLNGMGLAMIHRLDLSTRATNAPTQLMWTLLAMVGFIAAIMVLRHYQVMARFPYLWFGLGITLLFLPLVPGLGREINGSQIWIGIGPYSFQPSEIAKIVLAIAFASYLTDKRDVLALAGRRLVGVDLPRARDLGPIAIMWAAAVGILVFQRDLGTSLLFFGLFVMMLYVATQRPGWPILGVGMFLLACYVGYLVFGHVQVRVNAWLDPFSDFDRNYQIIQAQYGMAAGGLLGTGLGLGRPELIPVVKSDMITAAFGEELGVTGLIAIIVLYGLLVARGLRSSLIIRDPFGKLLSAGLAFVFTLQVFTIVGGVTRLLPLTGQTTPFLSQGGSSMLANWLVLALLMVISHNARKPQLGHTPAPAPSLAGDTTQVIGRRGAFQNASQDTPTSQPTPQTHPKPPGQGSSA